MLSENKKSIRWMTAMGAKDRIMGYVCADADESDKLQMAIIGWPKQAHFFRFETSPVPYFFQTNLSSNSVSFGKWISDMVLPQIRKQMSKDVILVIGDR